MSLELTTLRMFKKREVYEKLRRFVPERALELRTGALLDVFGQYFKEHPEVERIEPEPFGIWFKLARPKLKDEEHAIYAGLFQQVAKDNEPGVEAGLMNRLVAADIAAQTMEALEEWNAGADFDLLTKLSALRDKFEEGVGRRARGIEQDLTPIEQIIADEENEVGFKFRLESLNLGVKPLRPGDFMIFAARPDAGKTTAIASEVTYMASQVDALFPNEKRSILWLCNEGPTKQIVYRTFQAALGVTDKDMVAMAKKPHKQYGNELRAKYVEALGGRPGVLRVFPIHEKWSWEIEELFKQEKPALVVFDMIDNVKFGGELANMGTRTDQVLEAMYQWARMKAVQYDCAVIATSQISAEGDNTQWPAQSMLKDSKTGKQGAADIIVMMGKLHDPQLEAYRYISTPKNKRKRTGQPSCIRAQVIFDGDRARLKDDA